MDLIRQFIGFGLKNILEMEMYGYSVLDQTWKRQKNCSVFCGLVP